MITGLRDEQMGLHDEVDRLDEFGQRKMRVLVANEPRLYREAIAATLQELEPGVEVRVVEPEALDEEVNRDASDLVFCSRATLSVVVEAPVWVELYPEEQPLMVIGIEGTRLTAIDDTGLPNLLWIVDQARLLFHHSSCKG